MKIVIELSSKNEALITVITMALFLLLTLSAKEKEP